MDRENDGSKEAVDEQTVTRLICQLTVNYLGLLAGPRSVAILDLLQALVPVTRHLCISALLASLLLAAISLIAS
jgi:hypothetical protein